MQALDITPDKRELIALVREADEGRLCLPNFQRDFVWPREQVADLLRSVVRGYFIGSLLLLRSDPKDPPFPPTTMRGARGHARPDHLLLDGQQRITSLLYALTAPDAPLKDGSKPRRFFLDLNLLADDPDDDDIVFDRAFNDLNGLGEREVQYQNRVIPFTDLIDEGAFYHWLNGLEDWLMVNEPEQWRHFRKVIRLQVVKAVDRFQDFLVPLVELPRVDNEDADAVGRVCAIFEKLNSTGIELSVYDLLTARLYPRRVDLHELWATAVEEHELLARFSGGSADHHRFGVLLLRTVALLRDLEARPRTLISLNAHDFPRDWRRAASAMERALRLVTRVTEDGFGAFSEKFIPGFALLPVLAALRSVIEDRRLGPEPRSDLRRWYWSSVFTERYSSAVETKSRRDYVEFTNYWLNGGPEPSVFADARARIGSPGYSVADPISTASAIYVGVFNLLAIRGAKDWRLGEDIDLHQLDDHHVFPQAYLQRKGISGRGEVNSILNRTLIAAETNRKIRDLAPADYLAHPDVFKDEAALARLPAHFIGADTRAAMELAHENLEAEDAGTVYGAYRAAREAEIVAMIRTVCGVLEPTT